MIAAAQTMTPKKVVELFSPYYTATIAKKRGSNPAKDKQQTVSGTLCQLAEGHLSPWSSYSYYRYYHDFDETQNTAKKVKLAPEWLDAAVAAEDLTTVHILARPKHKATNSFLTAQADKLLSRKSGVEYEVTEVVNTMNRIKHPQAVDYFLQVLEKAGKAKSRYGYAWWIVRLIPELPKSAAKRIEEILPGLSEQTIDSVIPYVEALKAK